MPTQLTERFKRAMAFAFRQHCLPVTKGPGVPCGNGSTGGRVCRAGQCV